MGWEAGIASWTAGPCRVEPDAREQRRDARQLRRTILAEGADWFRTMGTAESPGTLIVPPSSVMSGGRASTRSSWVPRSPRCSNGVAARSRVRVFKAVLSGVSNPVLPAEHFDTPVTYEDFAAAGSGLGAAGFVVYDDTVNMTGVAHEISRFLAVESCGQCPACKEGCAAITDHLADIIDGRADDDVLGQLNARFGPSPTPTGASSALRSRSSCRACCAASLPMSPPSSSADFRRSAVCTWRCSPTWPTARSRTSRITGQGPDATTA